MIKLKRNRRVGSLQRVLVVLVVVLAMAACQSEVTISMTSDIPPSFTFEKGHVNFLDFFIVKEIATENQNVAYVRQDPDKNVVVWQVWPQSSDDGRIDNLPTITYGKVPSGFIQKIPASGPPAALVEGKVYEAGGPPVTMSKGFLRFIIKDGKAIRIAVPGQE